MGRLHPVDGSFYLPSGKSGAALGLRIIGTMNGGHIAVFIRFVAFAFHKICMHQPHLISRKETEILLRRLDHEVLSLNIQFPSKRKLSHAKLRIFHIIIHIQVLDLSFRIIINHQTDRI